jgi:glycosyltransferase involved in cell wall biosynthesis
MPTYRKLRILQIFSRYEFVGGEEIMVERIGKALALVHTVANFFGSTAELLGKSWSHRAVAPIKSIHNWDALNRLEAAQRRDQHDLWIIHNVFPGLSPGVYALGFRLGVPIVQYLHNYRISCTNGFFLNHGQLCTRCLNGNFFPAFATACWRESRIASGVMGLALARLRHIRVFDRVSHWVALSENHRSLHLKMGIPPDRITVVRHFIDLQDEPPPFPDNGYFLYLGRLSVEKGPALLLEAWAKRADRERRLVIAGTGPEESALKAFCRSNNLHNVDFTGFVASERWEDIWRGACALIVPSCWFETFGMVVLEAWAHARPPIVARIGGLQEFISEGRTGHTFSPGSAVALSEVLTSLARNTSQMKAMGMAGYERARNDYSAAGWFAQIEPILQGAVAGQ